MSTTTTTMTSEQRMSKLFKLLEISGKKEHISGNMAQLDHALQVANLAKIDSADKNTTLATLMLNTGGVMVIIPPYPGIAVGDTAQLLCSGYSGNTSDTFDSDVVDDVIVRKLGFSNKTSELVESNILAKRYLGGMTPEGLRSIIPKNIGIIKREDLVAGVRVTIPMWGGPLSPTEMREFEKDLLFKQKMQLAVWDVAATKTTGDKPPALDTYRDMAIRNMLMSMRTLY
ncbi:hypothetical protein GGI03_000570 [Coemansia sp. RSA 2337]|nr:hypothetical protein GGI14_000981 [Coemansia sp. S680]KAJ2041722.1 hypothetical protein H4S03_000139 [Coemansia sp. S3946]KAJ2053747.1 hypothetical protein H4S04_000471 [Coemansia sp. S16]KAJ2069846.1 hypothetical protein GGI08_000136 [Coemansia sp. S2]KAJ2354293.1 hypothetical protein GGH92_000128 [Coemansia sp. RSA 2673]KAJ2432163.1 hypothetical protein GGF41_000159 [Coemansia sp. RSA 2531]KAJ2469107.1 hypothetical protein GGI03_000570 [Coemansia sp. RSA 2337]